MKKITLHFLLTILPVFVGFAQGTQDFETQTALTTQYANGSFTEDGITYTYVHCRNEGLGTNDDNSITGKGIMLRRPNEPSSLEWTIPNGIGTLSFDARKAFSGGNNNRQLEVLVNGTSVWTSPTFGASGEDSTVHPFTVPIDEQGSTTVKIQLIGANGNKQVTIDNISWTAAPPTYCTPSYFQSGSYTTVFSTSGAITNADYSATSQQGTQGYLDLSGDTSYNIKQTAGLSFDFTHTYYSFVSPNHTLRIWIDWNNDGIFDDDDTERVINAFSAPGTQTGTIFIPDDTPEGNYRMRMRSAFLSAAPNACELWNSGQAIDFTLIVEAKVPCSGTPTIGNVILSHETANVSETYNVGVSSYPAETGLTFVWESSTDNWATTTTEYTGNTYQSLTKTALAPVGHQVKYRLKVTCSNSGLTTTSDEVTFTSVKEYCTPVYTEIDYYTLAFSTSVNGTTQTNYAATGQTGINGYNDLSGDASYNTTQMAGESFDFSHTHGGFVPENTVGIWIDWNNDGIFDNSTERMFYNYTGQFSTQVTQTGTITIPTGTPAGNYRMRVREQPFGLELTPCIEKVYGQTLDFTLVVNASSCIVNIPDPNFKNALLTHSPTIDTNGDGEIQCTEAQAFTSNLNVYSKNISDLTGIEAFTNLTYFSCDNNQLTGNLDFSSNTSLTSLYCGKNQLTSINVSGNTNLIYFEVHENNLTSIDVSNSPNLEWLNVEKNQLTSLNVDNNTALKTIYAQDNNLTSLNLSNNTLLQSLMVNKNQLTTLNLSNNTGLEYLRCEENQLTSLNVSNFPNLGVVYCNDNQITDLNVDNAMTLRILRCQNNQISSLYLINNWGLEQVYCDFNQLTSSGLSLPTYANTPLKLLSCSNNLLTSLDLNVFSDFLALDCSDNNLTNLYVKNGNNSNITNGNFWANNNPNLNCIEVDNATYSTSNWTNIDSQTTFSEDCAYAPYCIVDIPDANFKAYLVGNTAINTNGDTEIQCDEAEAFTGSMFPIFQGITDMTGIEAFVNMTNLYCGFNQITTLDVSSNTQLEMLYCQNNEITNLDITGLTSLTYLFCSDNQLATLDLSTNTVLESLLCYTNELTSLDVSNNVNLIDLMCFGNQLSVLDLSNNINLQYLACEDNELTTLDLSNNTDLEYLRCNNNQITALDLSSHPNLTDLQCQFNQLSSLNVKNGNNTDIITFNSIANTNLTCIEVDDATYSTTTWTAVDAWSTFSENCTVSVKDIANPISITVYPNPVNDMLHFSSNQPIENVLVTNMLGQQINVSVSSDKMSIDMSDLPTGNYFVKITIEGVAKMIKVVKN